MSEDTISRQAAIGAIEEYADRLQMVNWKENPNVPYKVHSLNWCINTIRDLPSIDAVPLKHGRWEYIGGYGYKHRCSECFKCAERISKYCPNCGARMDGEKNE